MRAKISFFLAILIGSIILAACSNDQAKEEPKPKPKTAFKLTQASAVKIDQIRGIGYPGNDKGLYLATNKGLNIFQDSKWLETTTNRHDYIGFQAVETGFIASGHPQKGSGYEDPLGVVESKDRGETLDKLAYYGKFNFHFLSAGFSEGILYVINAEQSDELGLGVHYSTDWGKTWQKSEFAGFNADSLGMIAVHPVVGKVMAMSTRSGIYYSEDFGNTMKLITAPVMVTALTFSDDAILYSSVENEKILLKTINPKTGEQGDVKIPFLSYENPITYLAVNPNDRNQMAFTTYKNDVYATVDGGKTWSPLLVEGKKERE